MSSTRRVLLTGASGFVAAHVLKELLDAGYWVRSTVRSVAKQRAIETQYPDRAAQLDFVIVEDIAAPHAFDKAVVADPPLDFVVHTASPFHWNVQDPEKDFLLPAVQGTKGLLQSVKEYAPAVQRVVVTSSFATILDKARGAWPGTTFTEADWNPLTWEDGFNPAVTYLVSKKYAELAATKFVADEKPRFDLVVLNPPWIFGPVLNEQNPNALNTSTVEITKYLFGESDEIDPSTDVWVDVRDVAIAHVRALEVPEAGGQRFIICGDEHFSRQIIVDILRKNFPEFHDRIPVGQPGVELHGGIHYRAVNSRAKEVLGIKFRTLEESVVACF